MAIPVMAQTMRPVSIDDLISVRKPTELALSPDGRWVAYVVMSPGLRDNSYTHDLYVVPSSGKGQPQRVLQGEPQTGSLAAHQRLSPTWAPGSDRLAISATRADGVEVRVVHIDSAKSELLLKSQMIGEDMELKLGDWRGSSLGFSPNGRWLAFLVVKNERGAEPPRPLQAVPAGEDWSPQGNQRRPIQQLFVMDLDSKTIRALTDASLNVAAFDWSPDGERLALEADADPTRETGSMVADIYVVNVADGSVRQLIEQPGMDRWPKWSPDGRFIAFGSQRGKEDWMYSATLAIVPADGSTPARYIGEALDRVSGDGSIPVRWSPDGKSIDVAVMHDLGKHLFRVSAADGHARRLTPRMDRYYSDFSYSIDGQRVAFTAQGAAVPAEVFVSSAREIEPMPLTDLNHHWQRLRRPSVETIEWRSPDGKWNLKGLLLKPSHYRPNQSYPVLTALWGGPSMVRQQLNVINNYPLLVLAERGYVVFLPNSRGRAGFGKAFAHAIRDEQSYVLNPMSDVLSGVDLLIEQGVADPERLGVLGFSYGGTLTSYIITQTDRFRAAIYGEGSPNVLDDVMRYSSSEYLPLNRDMWGIGNPYEPSEIQRAFEQSALYRLNRVRTPVLVESGESGTWETDRQFYRGLKYFGVPAEFWVYPRSGHGWDEPALKQDAYRRHIAWFDYWLLGEPYPDPRRQAAYDAWRSEQKNDQSPRGGEP